MINIIFVQKTTLLNKYHAVFEFLLKELYINRTTNIAKYKKRRDVKESIIEFNNEIPNGSPSLLIDGNTYTYDA
jgi:hypothetical protein